MVIGIECLGGCGGLLGSGFEVRGGTVASIGDL